MLYCTRKRCNYGFITIICKTKAQRIKSNSRRVSFKAGVGLRFVRELEEGKKTLRLNKVNDVLALFGKEVGVIDKLRE